MTLIRIGLTATLVGVAVGGLLGAAFAGERSAPPSAAEGARPARLFAPCPEAALPGTILWSFQTKGGAGGVPITGIPAVAEDGSVYVVTSAARLYGVDCQGEQRWVLTYRHGTDAPVTSLDGAPSLGEDGAIHVGGNAIDPNVFLALAPEGRTRWVYPHAGGERFNASSALDGAGRIFTATSGQDRGRGGNIGSILAFTPSGTLLPGFRLRSEAIDLSPVVLGDDRVVFISSTNVRFDLGSPTPTPVRPTPTPWANAVSVVHLPLSLTFVNVALPVSPPGPTVRPNEPPGPSPRVIQVPAQLHILSGAQPPAAVSNLPGRIPNSAMAAAGGMVVLEMIDSAPHLAAFDVDAQPPRLLWEHFLRADIAGAPLIGRKDPVDGRYELVYLDRASTLVSLMVPGAATPGDPVSPAVPTFNWAVQLSGSAQSAGAPALGDADRVYVAAGNAVEAYGRSDGELAWSTDIGPDVATGSVTLGPGGVLYVGTEFGRLLAIATESTGLDPEAAWPALRHDARNTGRTSR